MKMKKFTAVLAVFALFFLGGTILAGEGQGHDGAKATHHAMVSTFEVNGMTCGGCSSGLRLNVKKLEGVEDVKVSHEENYAQVKYDPEKVSTDDILKVIEKMGFKGKLTKTEEA